MSLNIQTLLSATWSTKLSTTASLAWVIYDISYVWKTRWSFGKGLFIYVVLYFGSLTNNVATISEREISSCRFYIAWVLGSGAAVLSGTGVSMLILEHNICQIHAVYNCNWKVTGVAVCFLIFAQICVILSYCFAFPGGAALPFGLTGCYIPKKPPFYALVGALICDTALCAFMAYRAWRLFTENRNPPLLKIVIRDSTLYFLTTFSALFLNTVIWGLGLPSLSGVAVPWMMAVSVAVGSRLSLNTRERYFNKELIGMPLPHA
ncbi:hypothetical protein JB92DRAFT_2911273 [Gautieria morchelliformis]|nr:hypothetical protein JB92DRAFT_2911273 [Gautieria morchelliformis]